jgi:hypothetical protein
VGQSLATALAGVQTMVELLMSRRTKLQLLTIVMLVNTIGWVLIWRFIRWIIG